MSSYVCNAAHISALAGYATSRDLARGCRFSAADDHRSEEELLARSFHRANEKSVMAQYRQATETEFRFDRKAADAGRKLSPVQIIKAVQAFEYQACEAEGWETSAVHDATQAILTQAIRELPGYEDAAWGVPDSLTDAPKLSSATL